MSLRYRSEADIPTHLRDGVRITTAPARVRKYRNQPTIEDGQRFDSKLEARCYLELKLRQKSGEVLWFLRQVNFPLEGDVVYRCDFLAALADGSVEVIDATGMVTQVKANKLRQVKARYGIDVTLWRGK